MSVIQYPIAIPATVGTLPSLKFMVSSDSLAAVTTAGYLNAGNIDSAAPLGNGDIIMALYAYNTSTTSGTFGIFQVAITAAAGITLTSWANPGDAVLPTTAGRFAVFTDATGTITSAAGNATQLGNISAGASGTAGTLSSFPATASTGSLVFKAVSNSGNTLTTVSNASMGQASVISIPDPGTATADFALAPAALVGGNLVEASGTAGLLSDSGISAASISSAIKTQTAIVTLTTAQVLGMSAAPRVIVAAPPSGFAVIPIAAQIITVVVGTAFTGGGAAQLQWGATALAGGTLALDATTPAAEITAASSQVYTQYGVVTTTATAIATVNGIGLYFTNATGAFTAGGTSTVTVAVTYMTVPV